MHHFISILLITTASLKAQNWQPIEVPGSWESEVGDYDGFAWYRCAVEIPESWRGSRLLLSVNAVDDVDEAYFNGEKVGANGGLPPLYAKPSSDVRRPAVIDPDMIRFGESNLVAFRVYDHGGQGGLLKGPIQLGRLEDAIDLSGTWDFIKGDQKEHAQWPEDRTLAYQKRQVEQPAGHLGIVPADTDGRDRDMALVRKRFEGNKNVHSNIEGKGDPLPPVDALAALKPGDDFIIETVLTEPTITQPLYTEFDERGRLWVSEYIQYPQPAGLQVLTWDNHLRSIFDAVPPPPPYEKPEHQKFIGRDRISIHEDTDGDGTFDSHKVFADGLNIVTSTCQGNGGVWVMNPPYLLFFPDENQDDIPDKAPIVHLSGFGLEDTHSVANSLKWGPDGWLYGCTGSTVTARIRVTAKPEQAPLAFFGQNIWRYHPKTYAFELFAEGGWNTFGVDFDAEGRLYSGTNGGMQAVYFVQGGFYQKGFGKHGPHTNPHAFDYFYGIPIEGKQPRLVNQWVPYAGGAFPGHEGHFFGVNCLANELAILALEPDGSTFRSTVLPAAITTKDIWFRPVHATTGPDGALYIADFYDARITHVDPRDNWDRDHGRLYRLRHREGKRYSQANLSEATTQALVSYLDHPNKWHRWTARRLLVKRNDPTIIPVLKRTLKLDHLWTLHLLGGLDELTALAALQHEDVHVRLWTLRLLADRGQPVSPQLYEVIHSLARSSAPQFISQLAASLQRLPTHQALPLLTQILLTEQFTSDTYIPSQLWWALETHATQSPESVLSWLADTSLWQTPIVETKLATLLARRLASDPSEANLNRLGILLDMAPDAMIPILVRGIDLGLQGITLTIIPETLDLALAKASAANPQSLELLLFGLRLNSHGARETALGRIQSPGKGRLQLISALGESPTPELIQTFLTLAEKDSDPNVQRAAIHALQRAEDATIPLRLLKIQDEALLPNILTVLSGRPSWAQYILEALENKSLSIDALSIDQALVIKGHGDGSLTERLAKLTAKPLPSADRQTKIRATLALLNQEEAKGELKAGATVFSQFCGASHQLFDQGARIGPDLTGYDRSNREFLVTAIIDPNLGVREEYELTAITLRPTAEGAESTVVSGFVRALTATQLTLQDLTGHTTTLATRDILKKENASTSLMPEGILDTLTETQIHDLFAYLQSKPAPSATLQPVE
ncbi:MAG: hypothetical protein GWQ08_26225 [Verrucomicrobiaceae bacterium]|nr:hypothetical protein [Verrucomicrobiaceae bacterium]